MAALLYSIVPTLSAFLFSDDYMKHITVAMHAAAD